MSRWPLIQLYGWVDLLRRATGLDLGESEAMILADSADERPLLIQVSAIPFV